MRELIRHIIREQTMVIGEGSGGANKLNTEKFIQKAREVHGNKYSYDYVEYKTTMEPVIITCPIHGNFSKTPNKHISHKQGCPKCGRESMKEKMTDTKDIFLDKAVEKFGDKYDYSKVIYVNSNTKVKIICPIHGEFEQTPSRHIHGATGCPKCGGSEKGNNEKFIEFSKTVHGDKYEYDKVNYKNSRVPVTITCRKHGDFTQAPHNHIKGVGCPICNESKGETFISNLLKNNGIKFEKQKKFTECVVISEKNNKCYELPFDFYLPDKNICIEFDGRQHFEPVWGDDSLEKTKFRDKLKTEYCEENGIKLIRIPYTMKKEDIEPYILSELGM